MPLKDITELINTEAGATIYIVCCGTSLKALDFAQLNERVTIAVNDAVFFVPNASYHIFNDQDIHGRYVPDPQQWKQNRWWKQGINARPEKWWYADDTKIVAQYSGIESLLKYAPELEPRCYWYQQRGPDVRGENRELWVNNTTATAAIMLAWKLGAARIYILGFDCYLRGQKRYFYEPDVDERAELFYRGSDSAMPTDMHALRDWFVEMDYFDPEAIVNLSPRSNCQVWPRAWLGTVIPRTCFGHAIYAGPIMAKGFIT